MSLQKKNNTTELPVIKCPGCIDGDCYSTEIVMTCIKCSDQYNVDLKILDDSFKLSKIDNKNLNEYMKTLLRKKVEFERTRFLMDKSISSSEDDMEAISLVYKGNVLSTLRRLKRDYNLKNIMATVRFITEGFLYILSEVKKLNGNKIYLVDSNGNRSEDIKKGYLSAALDAFNKEQDKELVESFIDDVYTQMKAKKIVERKLKEDGEQ